MNHSTSHTPVDEYWSQFLGVSPERLYVPGVTVVPHKGLGDYRGVWFFSRHSSCIVSAPEDWVEQLQASRSRISSRSLTHDALVSLFGEHLGKIIGPAYDGYVRSEQFQPCRLHETTPVPYHDEAVRSFTEASEPEEWEEGGLSPDCGQLVACFDSDRIVALAGFRYRSAEAGDPCVITHARHRGRGYAKAAVSRVVEHELEFGRLVLYQTLLANQASVSVATRLGFEQYANHVAVRLLDSGSGDDFSS